MRQLTFLTHTAFRVLLRPLNAFAIFWVSCQTSLSSQLCNFETGEIWQTFVSNIQYSKVSSHELKLLLTQLEQSIL